MVALIGARRDLVGKRGFDPAALAWMASVIGQGGTVSGAQVTRTNNFIKGAKAKRLWSVLDYALPIASENVQQGYTDLKKLLVGTPVNNPTFTASQGLTSNGTTSYLNTNFAPSTKFVAGSQNSAHLSLYDRTNDTTANGVCQFGAGDNAFANIIAFTLQPGGAPSATIYVNQTANGSLNGVTSTQGLWIINRKGPLGADQDAMRNAVPYAVGINNPSTGVTANPLFVGAFNNNGTPQSFVADQIAFVTAGGGLTVQQEADLSILINAYMTSLGTNVF